MKRALLLIAPCTLLFGCADTGKPVVTTIPATDTVCNREVKGYTDGTIRYRTKNKFEVSVKLKFEVGANTELRLKLDPKQGSDDAVVSIIGRKGTLPRGGGSTPFNWLNKSGKAADFKKGTMVLCVPPDVPKGTVYKFDVEIAGIGKVLGAVDPRIDVNW